MSNEVFRSEAGFGQALSPSIYTTSNFSRNEKIAPDDPILEELYEFRLRLLSQGWEPVPVRGKHSLLSGWTSGIITPQRIRAETSGMRLNTGFRTGLAVGVDNDLTNPEYAAAVDEIVEYFLGRT